MDEQEPINVFDWSRIFDPTGTPLAYLWEIGFRTMVMFLVLIIALKFLSKRGVKQLSVFELAILIALGSATGDPMFYKQIPITHGVVVLLVVILLYRLITGLTGRSKTLETLLEGRSVLLLNEGLIVYLSYKRVGLPYDKFFAELRLKGVDHLGQVRKVYLETSGEMSVYFFADEAVRPGLPIYPELIAAPLKHITTPGEYACVHCGSLQVVADAKAECAACGHGTWLPPSTIRRVQ